MRTVALVGRLERIKLPHVAAAAELVSGARAAGGEVVLEVHGTGHAESQAVALLEAAWPASAFTMHGATYGATSEPLAAVRGANVVVDGAGPAWSRYRSGVGPSLVAQRHRTEPWCPLRVLA